MNQVRSGPDYQCRKKRTLLQFIVFIQLEYVFMSPWFQIITNICMIFKLFIRILAGAKEVGHQGLQSVSQWHHGSCAEHGHGVTFGGYISGDKKLRPTATTYISPSELDCHGSVSVAQKRKQFLCGGNWSRVSHFTLKWGKGLAQT